MGHTKGYDTSIIELTTTTDSIPKTFFSIALQKNKKVVVSLNYCGITSDFLMANAGHIKGLFTRANGNIIQQGNLITEVITGFIGLKPTCTMLANPVTNTIDVIVEGLAKTEINWEARYYLLFNN